MSNAQLEAAIETAWEARDTITPQTTGETRDAIVATLDALDSGKLRVAEKGEDGNWTVNQWAKKAVLLGFRQLIGALLFHRVLSSQHKKRLLQPICLPANCH